MTDICGDTFLSKYKTTKRITMSEKAKKLSVKCPILGFEETKNMEFIPVDDIFVRLKSTDGRDFTFIVIDAQLIRPGYNFDIPLYYQQILGLEKDSNRQAFVIMALHEDINDSTLNFLAPILINWDNNSLAQVILDSSAYPDFSQMDKISNYLSQNKA